MVKELLNEEGIHSCLQCRNIADACICRIQGESAEWLAEIYSGHTRSKCAIVVLEGPATYGDYQYIKFSLAYGKQYVDARHAFVTSRLWRNVPADIVNMATSQRSYPGWAFPGDLAQAPTAFVTIDQDDRTVVWIGVDGTAIARRPID